MWHKAKGCHESSRRNIIFVIAPWEDLYLRMLMPAP
jgi:hypothetical protein